MKVGLLPESIGGEAISEIAQGCDEIKAEFVYFRSCAEVLRFLDQKGENSLTHLIVGLRVPWAHHESNGDIEIDDIHKLAEGKEPPWFFPLYDELLRRNVNMKIHVLSFTADLFIERLNSMNCGVTPIDPSVTVDSLRLLASEVLL
jgi:hypothetical protein